MTTSRSVRVFLSSTFRDFAEERDSLVRKVFPELRRRARERNVEFIDIDLRWGITPERAERGEGQSALRKLIVRDPISLGSSGIVTDGCPRRTSTTFRFSWSNLGWKSIGEAKASPS